MMKKLFCILFCAITLQAFSQQAATGVIASSRRWAVASGGESGGSNAKDTIVGIISVSREGSMEGVFIRISDTLPCALTVPIKYYPNTGPSVQRSSSATIYPGETSVSKDLEPTSEGVNYITNDNQIIYITCSNTDYVVKFGLDPDVFQYVKNIQGQSGGYLFDKHLWALNTFVLNLKKENIWDGGTSFMMNVFAPVQGGTPIAHTVGFGKFGAGTWGPWDGSKWTINADGTMKPTNTYIDLGWIPSQQVNGTTGEASMGVLVTTNTAAGNKVEIGAKQTNSGDIYYQLFSYLGSSMYIQLGVKNINQSMGSISSSSGFNFSSRSNATTQYIQRNTTQIDAMNHAGVFLPTIPLFLGAENVNGSPQFYTDRTYGFLWLSNKSITKSQGIILYNLVTNLRSAFSQ